MLAFTQNDLSSELLTSSSLDVHHDHSSCRATSAVSHRSLRGSCIQHYGAPTRQCRPGFICIRSRFTQRPWLRWFFRRSVRHAWLTGTTDDRGDLVLSGTWLDFATQIHGHLTPNGEISVTYVLSGATTQEGTFDVEFEHPLTSRIATDLIGAWEIGGGLPTQTNPITGEASGISFVEVRRLEIFPEGKFKHVQSHRHCEGSGLRRCCEDQVILEQGELSFDDRRMTLNVEGGGTISRNGCNPSLNKEGTVTPRKLSFQWTLQRASNGPAKLCLQGDSGEKVCYQKQ